jgi:hypothetical protein
LSPAFRRLKESLLKQGLKTARVFHKHLFGVREIWTENVNNEKELTGGKYQWLSQNDKTTTEWKAIEPNKPFYLFTPQDETLREEYQSGWKITEMMLENNMGITTGDDNRFVRFSKDDFEKDELKLVQKVSYRIFDERSKRQSKSCPLCLTSSAK